MRVNTNKKKLHTEKLPTREENKAYLIEHGVRPSLQQLAVLEYLQVHKTHPTVDEIYEGLRGELPTLSKTTVYNILKRLNEAHIIQMISIDERNVRFDGELTPHAHFKCKHCGAIMDLEAPKMEHVVCEHSVIHDVHIYYTGLCYHCKNL